MLASENPYVGPIVDLVNPYVAPHPGLPNDASDTARIYAWLEAHPGRWAKVGEKGVGMPLKTAQKNTAGYRVGRKKISEDNVEVYLSKPHPLGEELLPALRRVRRGPDDLPFLSRSEFNWSPEELAEATLVARANLFPVAQAD